MSSTFKKFLKCSYNFECSQQDSSFLENDVLNDAKLLIRENFSPKIEENFKFPKLSLSKGTFFEKNNRQIAEKPSLTTITSSNISNLTFQNVNSEFENNSNNNCQRKFTASNNSEASFVAMLKLNNNVSNFLVYKNRPRNQYISFSNYTKI